MSNPAYYVKDMDLCLSGKLILMQKTNFTIPLKSKQSMRNLLIALTFCCTSFVSFAQNQTSININQLKWLPNSHQFWVNESNNIVVYTADNLNSKTTILSKDQLTATGFSSSIQNIVWSANQKSMLIYTNSKKVWRANTQGDYWLFDLTTGKGRPIGKGMPASSLQFAKFSPNGKNIAYVSKHNLYVEDVTTGKITALTTNGTDRLINGTFDWAYEEEFFCRDGFRWNPDSKSIAYWNIDATKIRNHLMINNTDSLYPFTIPVEYPKAGESPSPAKVGVVSITTKKTLWMNIPGDPQQNYLPRMEWASANDLTVLQINRRQNEAHLFKCNPATGNAQLIFTDKDEAWVDVATSSGYDSRQWTWVENGKAFIYSSDRDGWMHLYKVSADGKQTELLTKGNYDTDFKTIDAIHGDVYFYASPTDATQQYLYKVNITTKDTVRVTPAIFNGTNNYTFSPDAQFAKHTNASITRLTNGRLVNLSNHKKVYPNTEDVFANPNLGFSLEKIKITTADNVQMDGIMAKPNNFNPDKKYPVCFYVYGEPAATVANDVPSFDSYISQLIPEGYIGIALDNRGTPAMKGREWRKSIYKKVGTLNTHDQAMATKEILKWKFIDGDRVAVHGWSGGGNMTLNLLFRYPEIYKTGVAVSSVTDHHFYDNIYTERLMGLPQDDEAAYKECSPITYAKNLKGNLLYIHGTGDDNVHYKNAEVLINELIKQGKLFNLMIYPNRTHGIFEGEGTTVHVSNTITNYLRKNNPPGAN